MALTAPKSGDSLNPLSCLIVRTQMEPSTRRTAELCMRNLSSNLRMAQAHGVPMLPIRPLHLLA